MTKSYRLYLEGVKEVADEFERDGTEIGAEESLNEICNELRLNIEDCLIHAQEIIDFFDVAPDKFKILEVPVDNAYVRFISVEEAVQMIQKLKNLR